MLECGGSVVVFVCVFKIFIGISKLYAQAVNTQIKEDCSNWSETYFKNDLLNMNIII